MLIESEGGQRIWERRRKQWSFALLFFSADTRCQQRPEIPRSTDFTERLLFLDGRFAKTQTHYPRLYKTCACPSIRCNATVWMELMRAFIPVDELRVRKRAQCFALLNAADWWLCFVFFLLWSEPCTLIIDGTVTSYIPNEMQILRFLMMQDTAYHLSTNCKTTTRTDVFFFLPTQREIKMNLIYTHTVYVWNKHTAVSQSAVMDLQSRGLTTDYRLCIHIPGLYHSVKRFVVVVVER